MPCGSGCMENGLELNSYDFILEEKRVIGSYSARALDFLDAMALMQKGLIRTDGWVEAYPLADAARAFHMLLAARSNIVKAIILP